VKNKSRGATTVTEIACTGRKAKTIIEIINSTIMASTPAVTSQITTMLNLGITIIPAVTTTTKVDKAVQALPAEGRSHPEGEKNQLCNYSLVFESSYFSFSNLFPSCPFSGISR
jgi:hypothetical protein